MAAFVVCERYILRVSRFLSFCDKLQVSATKSHYTQKQRKINFCKKNIQKVLVN